MGYFNSMAQSGRLRINRAEHQFAAAHFLVGMGKCERLHGHNYTVSVELAGSIGSRGVITDFNVINPVIEAVCRSLDHRVLIAEKASGHRLSIDGDNVEIEFKARRYVFPREDCMFLPVDSTTVEALSAYIAEKITGDLREYANIEWIEIEVSEGASQSASTRRKMK